MEVAHLECHRQRGAALDIIDMSAPPRIVLGQTGRHFLRFITSRFGKQIYRICVAEAERFPELGQRFFESGPAVMRAEMAVYFTQACGRGELEIRDYVLAADQFTELCKADLWMRLIFGVVSSVSAQEIDRVVDSAVETFLARYGT
jgi:hypothetical protein